MTRPRAASRSRRRAAAAGFEVMGASSAADALPLAAGADAVVTDLVMPGDDRLVLAARLRELGPGLPVLLFTARGFERTAGGALEARRADCPTVPHRHRQV